MNTTQDALQSPRGLARADGTAIGVLVVDDEPTLAEVLASVLRYEGWEVRTAADGTSAVRAARDFEPDAVILDVMLPDVDGLEVLRRLRAVNPDVCVLFLTAKDAVEDRIAGITAGGDDYEHRLHQVLANLLSNARTHTPPGSTVTVRVTRTTAAGQRDLVELSVHDDGPGIPAELREHIWERFARADTARSRTAGSTGLGLAIVRAVVTAHGGRIELASEPGSTTFLISLTARSADGDG